ncbi:LysM peptidoglycan-binding domain-containing protein [Bacillus sp. AK128]
MSDLHDHRDQAQILRERMNKKELEPSSPNSLDVLSLPPRSKVHHEKDEKKKTKIKFRFPLLRLLTFLFVLLPIAILGYTFHQENENSSVSSVIKKDSTHSEEISIGTKKEVNNTMIENETSGEEDSVSEPIEDDVDNEKPSEETGNNTSSPSESKQQATEEIDYQIIRHEVKPNETLYSISQLYFKSRDGEKIIKEWNQLTNNKVKNGVILEIPLKPTK